MIDTKLKLRLHHLLVDQCHDDLKQEGINLYNSIIHVLESEWKPINEKIEATLKEVDEALMGNKKIPASYDSKKAQISLSNQHCVLKK
jgi:hypothetical protein